MLSIDRLSALPDFVLIHILSLLETKEAAVTALLSKRWRYLWTESPTLIFREHIWNDIQGTRMFVARVHGTLVNCRRNNLDRFEVNFEYRNCFERDVNVWIEFAVKNKVKNVYMLLGFFGDYHLLPQMIYSNSSLTTLRMQSCIMDRRRTIEWKSLAELYLERVELPQDVLDEILSGCYVLRNLHLSECWGFNSLMVNSRSLCKLEVHDCDYDEKEEDEDEYEPLEISAPYILSLDIRMFAATTRKLRVTNIPSLVTSSITFFDDIGLNPEVLMSTMNQFLESTKHVNELELGCESIMVLSCLIRGGQRLPQSSRRCLKLHAYSHKFSIYGIVGLLDSSPNLETLVIEIHAPSSCGRYCFEAPWDDLAGDLLHLKNVTVTNLSHSDPSYEPLIILPQILLKRAVALEKMVIYLLDITPPSRVGTSDPFKIAQTLLSYPRSSQKAVVFLHQRYATESTRFLLLVNYRSAR